MNTTLTATIAATASTTSATTTSGSEQFQIGDRVFVNGIKPGRLAFLGTAQFKEGEWAGVVLDTVEGKNNGSVNGVQYFDCGGEMKGVFCRPNKLTRTFDPSVADSAAAAPPATPALNASSINAASSGTESNSTSGLKIGDRVLISSAAGGAPKIGTLRLALI